MSFRHVFLAALLACSGVPSRAQVDLSSDNDDTTVMVRGTTDDPTDPQPIFQGTWRFASNAEPEFEFLLTARPDDEGALGLDQLLVFALNNYLDERIHFNKQGVQAEKSADELLADMNAMVRVAAAEFAGTEPFLGFSSPARDQLIRVVRIDWSNTAFSVDAIGGDEKYLAIFRYVRSQRLELERQLRAELVPLAAVNVLGAADALPPGRTERINSVCGTVFDEYNFLCALDLTMGDSTTALPDPRLRMDIGAMMRAPEPDIMPPGKIRKRDRWLKAELDAINERIDDMDQRKELWAIRDRLDDLQGQMDDMRLEVQDVRAAQEATNASDNPGANLSKLTGRNITIRFDRNSSELDKDYRVLLNEVFEQLARNPKDRVLITGYTDRSGDAAVNLALSEQRAKAVRAYLMQRGIAADRLLVNFYGDSRSLGRDPGERRVEVEWLN